MKNSNSKGRRVRVVNVSRSEGPLYARRGEDGELHVFDCTVTALAEDGKIYSHIAFVVRGAVMNEDGFYVANYNYKNEVEAFIARVEARGSIDLRFWVEVPPMRSWEENEEWNLKCEADERAWGGWS